MNSVPPGDFKSKERDPLGLKNNDGVYDETLNGIELSSHEEINDVQLYDKTWYVFIIISLHE